MLAGLAELRKEAGFVLHCAHVEHGIRPPEESRGDARAVKAFCEDLEVPCRVVSITPGKIAAFARGGGPGIEGAARFFRGRVLRREARRVGAGYILTAHTRDDLLETLLMRVLRGSGPAGLAAMPRVRGCMLRPLLDVSRRDVLAYLEERGIPYRTDSSNADIRFTRNRVRRKLVPLLDEFFPSWRSSLLAMAETQTLAAEFLAGETNKRLSWKRETGKAGVGVSLKLSEADFFNAPRITREEAIFAGVNTLTSLRAIAAGAPVPKRAVVRRAAGQSNAAAVDLGPARFRERDGYVELMPAARFSGERGFSLLINETGVYTLKGKVFGAGKTALRVRAGLAASEENTPAGVFSAAFPLVLRNYRTGDRLREGGHTRGLSAILDKDTRTRYTNIITAEDTEGTAAFVCIKEDRELLVISSPVRAREAAGADAFSLFEVFGGVNA